jgi:hypothetical protein
MPCYDYCSEELVLNGPQVPGQICSPAGVHTGLFPTSPDVQSVWSFDKKRDNIEVIK